MKIIVCIKQVPDTSEVKLDPKTNTLIRDGVPSIINPDDKSGIEAALRIKEQVGGTVTVVSADQIHSLHQQLSPLVSRLLITTLSSQDVRLSTETQLRLVPRSLSTSDFPRYHTLRTSLLRTREALSLRDSMRTDIRRSESKLPA